ncbi:MAG: DUF7619 domain-containing protein [Thermoanaerobaculia bacterium]
MNQKRGLLALLALVTLAPTPRAEAQCTPGPHAGTITADQTWCVADSPHVLTGVVTVAAGATLTIEAGSIVKPATLTILGHLIAVGTETSPITLTSDGPGWESLTFAGGTGLLRYVDVLKAGWNAPGIVVANVAAPGVVFERCTLGPGNKGFSITDGVVAITDSRFEAFVGAGLYPIEVHGSASALTLANDTFVSSGLNQVFIAAGAMTNADFSLVAQAGLEAWHLGGDYTIPAGRTVTVGPGVNLYQNGGLHVTGRLLTNGTAAEPVTITNGYRWSGVFFEGGTGTLTHVRITNAGFNSAGITATNVPAPGLILDHVTLGPGNGCLSVTDSVVSVADSTFTGIGDPYALHVRGAASRLTLAGNTFSANTRNQIHLEAGAMTGADFALVTQAGLEAWHLGGDYTIPAGRTVTVGPGVSLYQDGGLHVTGRLLTNGTAAEPVTITNGYRWTGVFFEGGTGQLTFTRITNAGFNSASLTATGAPLPGVVLDNVSIGPGNGGIDSTDSVLVVRDSTFETSADGRYAISVSGAASTLSLSNNSFGGTGSWARRIGLAVGAMTGADVTLVPQAGLEGYVFASDYVIPTGRTLTAEAGSPLIVGTPLSVRGRLVTRGTSASPVTIDGHRYTLEVDGGSGELVGALIRNGGFNDPALLVRNGGSLLLERSRLVSCNRLRAEASAVTLRNTAFLDGSRSALEISLASTLTALHTTIARSAQTAVVVDGGSTATLTNSVFAASPRGVSADATSTATLTNTLWDSVPTQVSGSVTQHGLLVGPASFEADGFHLGAASAALAQGVVTSVAIDLDGEARPRPATMLADLGADESDAGGLIAGRVATAIGFGETKSATSPAGAFADHVLALSAGEVPVLRVRVEAAAGTASFRLLVRSRQFPLATLFDVEGAVVDATTREVVIAAPAPGAWYLGVLSTAGDIPFTISVAGADRGVASISPSSGGNTGAVTVRVDGAGFVEGVRVELRSGGVTILSAAPSSLTSTQLTARLVLTGLAPQPCDACVVWPDATTHCVPGGFRIASGVAPDVDAHLSIPGVLRGGRGTKGVLSWENRGNVDADAPLFVVASDQDLPLRRDGREGWRRAALRFLGIDQASFGSAGVLPPGARGRVTFEIFSDGPAHAPATFTLRQLSVSALARTIDWAALEPSLRPEGLDAATWHRIFPLVTGAAGSTWGDYVGALRADASYLSGLGRHIVDPEALFGVTVQRALETSPQQSLASGVDALCPAPGPLLTFGRSFANGPLGRGKVGALGVGWTHTYDLALATLASGDREVRSNDGSTRLFRLLPDGTFRGLPGDHGLLIVSGATARLVERNGVALSFRADGRLASISDATGNRLDVTWDAAGHLSGVAHTCGDALSFDHDSAGRLVRLTDHAGQVTTYSYDGAGRRLVQVTQPGGRVTRYSYLGAGPDADALVSIEFPDGSHVFYDYDDSGRLVGHRRDTGPETSFSRDATGRIVQAHGAAPRGSFAALAPPEGGVLLALDESGRLGELVDPLGNAVGLGWNDDGDLGEVIDPFGDVRSIEHGPLGEVTALLQSGGIETRQSYSYPQGGGRFVRSLTDPKANVSAFTHDAAGRVTSITYPGGSSETLERDAKGLVTSTTNRRGQTIQYTRNGRGQLTRKELPDGTAVDYTYDAAGRLATVTEAGGTTRLTWDSRGFLSEIHYPGGKWFRYEMDDVGRTTRRTSDDGYVLDWEYDAAGRIVRIMRNGGTLVVFYEYDTHGRLLREERGNGTATIYAWDAASRATGVRHLGPGGSILADFTYTYDAAGRVVSASGPDGTSTYIWDAEGRLESERAPSGVLTIYRYDAAGNRVETETNGVVIPYTYNGQNQLTSAGTTSYEWDADGNLTSRAAPSGTTIFTWNAERKLTEVAEAAGSAAYAWSALGTLASETLGGVTSRFLGDLATAAGTAATVLDAAGAVTGRFDHGAGLAAALDAAGNASSFHLDGLGNTSLLTNGSGAATQTYSYDAHGNVTASAGGGTNPYLAATGDGFRSLNGGLSEGNATAPYDPAAGRYASPSLKGYSGGANLYTEWTPKSLKPSGPPKSLGEKADSVLSWGLWLKNLYGKVEGPEEELGEVPLDAVAESGYSFLKGIWETQHAAEQNDTLGTIEGLGNSSLAAVEVAGTFVPPLRPIAAGMKVIATAGKTICDLYVRNLAPNSDPYWFQPVARNKYFYLQQNIARAGITPVDLELLERTPASDQVFPNDPNEKAATPGFGPRHLVRAGARLFYAISFENVATASAPAQEVFVTDSLDSGLDLSTLELVDVGWGATTVSAPEAARAFRARTAIVDHRPGDLRHWWVDLEAGERAPGRLAFTFRTLDPATGDLPSDALAGFLPPENGSGRGKGSVLFSVRTRTDLAPGTRIANTATIVFDTNAPITTNEVFHTIGLPGDVNDDGVVNPADVFSLVSFFYADGADPLGIADVNFDERVDALDLFYLINHLYAGGPAPV